MIFENLFHAISYEVFNDFCKKERERQKNGKKYSARMQTRSVSIKMRSVNRNLAKGEYWFIVWY